jgi:hypothetical protein
MKLSGRALALALAVTLGGVHAALAKGNGDDSASDDDDSEHAGKPRPKARDNAKDQDADVKTSDDDDDDATDDKSVEDKQEKKEAGTTAAPIPAVKQDLTGHDQSTTRLQTQFERDRFFVDKQDTDATADKTLIQGSFTSSSFFYTEFGGNYVKLANGSPPPMGTSISETSQNSILWTDLRLQTDFRHIAGSRWDARIDARVRVVDEPSDTSSEFDNAPGQGTQASLTSTLGPNAQLTPNTVQSGLTGDNEYDLRELWLIRNGERSDVTIGRQFITDLGAIKIDGVRVDYASSDKFTLLGFAGLYPLRGSRSITTDYPELYYPSSGAPGQLAAEGRFVGAGGFGAAYRTSDAYGAVGGVALVPLGGETPRIFGTANGYWRLSPKLDIYHFAIIDLIGNNDALGAGSAGLTNLSAGVNYKPSDAIRLTASYNRVDTDTLDVQAYAFLHNVDSTANTGAVSIYDNLAYLRRLAADEVRGGAAAGLGPQQRFEIATAVTYRTNPGFDLTAPGSTLDLASIPRATGLEVWGGITDRHSIGGLRISLDVSKTIGTGTIDYDRNEALGVRALVSRELASGRGEWELEAEYATVQDQLFGQTPACGGSVITGPTATGPNCFGTSQGQILTLGGLLYYRLNRSWFAVASLYLNETNNTATILAAMGNGVVSQSDPAITGVTGYLRFAYRF